MTESYLYQDLACISYRDALAIQQRAFDALLKSKEQGATGVNMLFFCEHKPVFTLGKSGRMSNLLVSEALLAEKGFEFYRTDRGGDITYHGPGQITGYPVFDLETFRIGLRQYVEMLEEVMIRFLSLYGVKGERLAGATGVWIEPHTARARKICAVGVKSSRFVTMHGFALNVLTDLQHFSLINPCGFTDRGVTSLRREVGEAVDFEEAKRRLRACFAETFRASVC
ncbi:MAG: lipoyl(octanoyl) transferase LipB [Tannerella sp.]|jgi:lipoyl(octanoyl) transferase|nr:lipoyl(octanoyl) transferase LipB [Tannerella sp.]